MLNGTGAAFPQPLAPGQTFASAGTKLGTELKEPVGSCSIVRGGEVMSTPFTRAVRRFTSVHALHTVRVQEGA